MNFRVPRKVKIGEFTYDVFLVGNEDSDFIHENLSKVAYVNYQQCYIKIRQDQHPQQIYSSLLHEVIHVLSDHCQMGLEELDVARFSYALGAFFKR